MKKTIAVFVGPNGATMIGNESWEGCMGYVAVTEIVEVDFPDLDPKEYVPKQVETLKAGKNALQEKYLRESAAVDEQIAKLTAITHQK